MASVPCRSVAPAPANRSRRLRSTSDEIAQASRELCAQGMVEQFKDEDGVVRYHPIAHLRRYPFEDLD